MNNKKITKKILKEVRRRNYIGESKVYSYSNIEDAISLALKERDADLKCTNCGKELPKSMMSVECPDCYILGFKKELKKKDAEIKKAIDERIEHYKLKLDTKAQVALVRLKQKLGVGK